MWRRKRIREGARSHTHSHRAAPTRSSPATGRRSQNSEARTSASGSGVSIQDSKYRRQTRSG